MVLVALQLWYLSEQSRISSNWKQEQDHQIESKSSVTKNGSQKFKQRNINYHIIMKKFFWPDGMSFGIVLSNNLVQSTLSFPFHCSRTGALLIHYIAFCSQLFWHFFHEYTNWCRKQGILYSNHQKLNSKLFETYLNVYTLIWLLENLKQRFDGQISKLIGLLTSLINFLSCFCVR